MMPICGCSPTPICSMAAGACVRTACHRHIGRCSSRQAGERSRRRSCAAAPRAGSTSGRRACCSRAARWCAALHSSLQLLMHLQRTSPDCLMIHTPRLASPGLASQWCLQLTRGVIGHVTDTTTTSDAMRADAAGAGDAALAKKSRKRKKRKPRYPKDYDPANPGPPPDPERWLPKWQRSDFKKPRKSRRIKVCIVSDCLNDGHRCRDRTEALLLQQTHDCSCATFCAEDGLHTGPLCAMPAELCNVSASGRQTLCMRRAEAVCDAAAGGGQGQPGAGPRGRVAGRVKACGARGGSRAAGAPRQGRGQVCRRRPAQGPPLDAATSRAACRDGGQAHRHRLAHCAVRFAHAHVEGAQSCKAQALQMFLTSALN